jgi:hypothetical protein
MLSPSATETVVDVSFPEVLASEIVVVSDVVMPFRIRVNARFFFPTPGAVDKNTKSRRIVPGHGRYRAAYPVVGPLIHPDKGRLTIPPDN